MPTFKLNITATFTGDIYIEAPDAATAELIVNNAPPEDATKVLSATGTIKTIDSVNINSNEEQIPGVDYLK